MLERNFEIYIECYQRIKYLNIFNLGSSVIRLSKALQTRIKASFKKWLISKTFDINKN